VLLDILFDTYLQNPNPLRGSRAYHDCGNKFDPCTCNGHSLSCALNRELDFWSISFMPKPTKKSSKSSQFSTEFVTYALSSDDKKAFAAWQKKNLEHLDDLVVGLLQTNHKVGFSFNENTDSFICSVTGKPEDCNNASKCFTSHAKDYATALWVALFKHYVIWNNGVWESLSDTEDFG